MPSGRPTYQPLRSPIQLNLLSATRRVRPLAIPPIPAGHATPPPWQNPHAGGNGGPPSGSPTRPATPSPPPTPTPSPGPETTRPTLTTQDLIQLVMEGVARAQAHQAPREERVRTSRLKMENPETFDGKPTTPFNTWWQSVIKYLRFYPETSDQQKIAWVGTLLTRTAKAWDLHRYTTLGENDTWANYAADIRTEYFDSREAANAQLKLSQLKYTGDIRAYMTEFQALNNYTRATGEGLQEKVDMAMPDAVLDMRFAHYLGEFADDEGFLQATYQAGLQVEKKKALRQAKEQMRVGSGGPMEKKKEERRKDNKERGPKKEESQGSSRPNRSDNKKSSWFRGKNTWPTQDEAYQGVPMPEREVYRQNCEDCWRCGRPGHKTYDCLSFKTRKGTVLPPAPLEGWGSHRGREKKEGRRRRGRTTGQTTKSHRGRNHGPKSSQRTTHLGGGQ